MKINLSLLSVLFLSCADWSVSNPNNCALNAAVCTASEQCNMLTQQCESLDCIANPRTCQSDQTCNAETRRCETMQFVMGQPDSETNVNARFGLSSPSTADLVPNGASSMLVVGDAGNHRVVIWKDVDALINKLSSRQAPDLVLGMPDINTLSATGSYAGLTSYSLHSPRSVTHFGTKLAIADDTASRILFWNPLQNLLPDEPSSADGVWGQNSFAEGGCRLPSLTTACEPRVYQLASPGKHFFVSDARSSRVMIFAQVPSSPSTPPYKVLSAQGSGTSRSRLQNPHGVYAGFYANGDPDLLYVADTDNNRVLGFGAGRWDESPTPATRMIGQPTWTSSMTRPGASGLARPEGVTACTVQLAGNPSLRIFVADTGRNRVLRFPPPDHVPDMKEPNDPTLSQARADQVLGQMNFDSYAPNRGVAPTAGSLSGPSDVRCDGRRLVVVDRGNHRVLLWKDVNALQDGADATLILGQPSASTAEPNSPRALGGLQFNEPHDVASDGSQLAVADTGNHRVLVWAKRPQTGDTPPDVVLGQPDRVSFTAPAMPTPSRLNTPAAVAILGNTLAVADTMHNRVLIWNALRSDTPHGSAADQEISSLNAPQGLALSGDQLFIADTGNHRLLVYTRTAGTYAPSFMLPSVPGCDVSLKRSNVCGPQGLSLQAGRLAVADTGNHRVLIWNRLPTDSQQVPDLVMGQVDFLDSTARTHRAFLAYPNAVLLTTQGLLASSGQQNRILYWGSLPASEDPSVAPAADRILGQDGSRGSLPNALEVPALSRLSSPGGLAQAGSQLYVADRMNNRVVVLAAPR
jgi:hypothetical protein